MNKEELTKICDDRIMTLIQNYYSPAYVNHRQHCIERIKEVAYLAEDMGLISYDDYLVIINIICYMGTAEDMEGRQW